MDQAWSCLPGTGLRAPLPLQAPPPRLACRHEWQVQRGQVGPQAGQAPGCQRATLAARSARPRAQTRFLVTQEAVPPLSHSFPPAPSTLPGPLPSKDFRPLPIIKNIFVFLSNEAVFLARSGVPKWSLKKRITVLNPLALECCAPGQARAGCSATGPRQKAGVAALMGARPPCCSRVQQQRARLRVRRRLRAGTPGRSLWGARV
jgi:hypothetical protein